MPEPTSSQSFSHDAEDNASVWPLIQAEIPIAARSFCGLPQAPGVIRKVLHVLVAGAILLPAPALASDPRGMISMLFGIAVLAPWVGLNFLLFLGLVFTGSYARARTAKIHSVVGALAPMLGLVVSAFDMGLRGEWLPYAVVCLASLGVTSLPWVVHRSRAHA